MAHKLETAHISFGLVTIPVGIYSAIEEQDIHFNAGPSFGSAGRGLPGMPGGPNLNAPMGARDPSQTCVRL